MEHLLEGVDQVWAVRPWGRYVVLSVGPGWKVKELVIDPGHRLSLQRHRFRSEAWTVVEGSGVALVDGLQYTLTPGEVVTVETGAWHRIENTEGLKPLVLIEVQRGPVCAESDIERWEDDYGRG